MVFSGDILQRSHKLVLYKLLNLHYNKDGGAIMTVKELIEKLNQIENKNTIIHVGCQGYTTREDPDDEYGIEIHNMKNGILICDNGYYSDTDCEL